MKTDEIKVSTNDVSKRPVLTILLFALVFLGPIIAAWTLFAFKDHSIMPDSKTNKGFLILPPLAANKMPLKSLNGQTINAANEFEGKWVLAYVNSEPCAEKSTCTKNLYTMRQVRRALGKNKSRLERLFIDTGVNPEQTTETLLQKSYPGTELALSSNPQLNEFFSTSKKLKDPENSLYIIDPNGNIMMSYASNVSPTAVLKDVKKLLKYSNIG